MNSSFSFRRAGCLAAILGLMLIGTARAQTNFGVTTPSDSFQYFINGVNSTGTGMGSILGHPTNNCPPLTLAAGQTYTFTISVFTNHPFGVVTTVPVSSSFYSGATPTNATNGTVTLTIPATNFPSTLYYQCNTHHFYGVITVTPPVAAPPQNTIISIVVMPTNVTLLSTGTNTSYVLVPQFNSNLLGGNGWLDVASFSNTFANGTNTTSFGRLDAICGPDVFLRISQRPPQ